MPLVLEQIAGGRIFGAMWFLLLFFAGITSSVALMQPTIALLREDFGLDRTRAVLVTAGVLFLCANPVIFFLSHGFMDQLDFWAGSFGLLLFGFLEIVVFAWVFGMTRGWAEINHGARLRIPRIFHFVIQWVMPLGMGAILLAWSATNLVPELTLEKVADVDRPYVLGARLLLVAVLIGYWIAVRAGSRRRNAREGGA
jgi:SNF family Na+-dependent transporter